MSRGLLFYSGQTESYQRFEYSLCCKNNTSDQSDRGNRIPYQAITPQSLNASHHHVSDCFNLVLFNSQSFPSAVVNILHD